MEPSSIMIKDKKDTEKIDIKSISVGFSASNLDYLKNCLQDSTTTAEAKDSTSSAGLEMVMLSAINECPFNAHTCPYASRVLPLKRRFNHDNGLCGVSDMGDFCDECGVDRITRPCFRTELKYDNDLCSICTDVMGQDVDIRIDLPVIPRRSLDLNSCYNLVDVISTPVGNDQKDPKVVNTEMDQDNALCDNKFVGVVEFKDLFADIEPHKDQETRLPTNQASLIGCSVTNSDSEPPTKALEARQAVQSLSSSVQDKESSIFHGLEDLGFENTEKNKMVLRINYLDMEQSAVDLDQFCFTEF